VDLEIHKSNVLKKWDIYVYLPIIWNFLFDHLVFPIMLESPFNLWSINPPIHKMVNKNKNENQRGWIIFLQGWIMTKFVCHYCYNCSNILIWLVKNFRFFMKILSIKTLIWNYFKWKSQKTLVWYNIVSLMKKEQQYDAS